MRALLDHALVGLVICVSAAYLVLALGPKDLRRRAGGVLAAGAARLPPASRLRLGMLRLGASLGAKAAGACGGCDNCGQPAATATATATADARSREVQPNEVRVPLARIGRRGVTNR